MKLTIAAILLLTSLITPRADAQLVITPATPDSSDVLTADIKTPGLCNAELTTVVTGNVIRTNVFLFGCIAGPPPFPVSSLAEFGPVAPGTYTYEVYFDYTDEPPQLAHVQAIIVSPAAAAPAVPLLGVPALVALLGAISILGVLTLRRV